MTHERQQQNPAGAQSQSQPLPPTSPAMGAATGAPAPGGDGTPRGPAKRILLIAALVAGVVAVVLGMLVGPQRQALGTQTSGDEALAARVVDAVGGHGGFRSVVVAEVTPEGTTWAGVGKTGEGRDGPAPTDETLYELGSVTKTFTASLFADAIDRGEVTAEDPLSAHIPELEGTPAGEVTLASLAQHSSGLPRLGPTFAVESLAASLSGGNPYGPQTTEVMIQDAAAAPVDPAQGPVYSNLGVALLGTALTNAAGADSYPALLEQWVLGPVGMESTSIATTEAEVPADTTPGFLTNGIPTDDWWGEGYAPTGSSTTTTVADLAAWASANLDGTAPGVASLEPTAQFAEGSEIGWIWQTTQVTNPTATSNPSLTWHSGGTGGFASVVMLDREADRAVVVLGNTQQIVDPIAVSLLTEAEVPDLGAQGSLLLWVTFGFALIASGLALLFAFRSKAALPIVNWLLLAASGLVSLWFAGPWAAVGGWAFGLALAPALAAVVVGVLRSPALRFQPKRWAWLSWVGLAIVLVILVATLLVV
ncbi:serine hydrolase domain-containing protein [Pseudoclavibacter sp. JSM 162008]|uniref:serine hydrolase domain-containing protein n=1 Tax=Pseudoclavibacter sp. JSM 162008 TaxID=3229855 RepID=UPI0035241094